MDLRLTDYALYLIASVLLTVWVGNTLFRNGRPFLVSVFQEQGLADSVNRLLRRTREIGANLIAG